MSLINVNQINIVDAPSLSPFTATIALGTISVKYNLASTTNDATMRYGVGRWGNGNLRNE